MSYPKIITLHVVRCSLVKPGGSAAQFKPHAKGSIKSIHVMKDTTLITYLFLFQGCKGTNVALTAALCYARKTCSGSYERVTLKS